MVRGKKCEVKFVKVRDSDVLTAVLLKVPALWQVTPCQLVNSLLFISLDKFKVNRITECLIKE
jgi:hypothetical protein